MGAGASLDAAAVLTKAEAMAAAGDQWDEAKWEAAEKDEAENPLILQDWYHNRQSPQYHGSRRFPKCYDSFDPTYKETDLIKKLARATVKGVPDTTQQESGPSSSSSNWNFGSRCPIVRSAKSKICK